MTTVPQLVYAPNCKEVFYVHETTPIVYDALKELKLKVLKAIIAVEKPQTKEQAIAAKIRENAVGLLQLRPVAIREVNRILGKQVYYLSDRTDSIKSVEIFFIIQQFHNPEFNPQKAAYVWNMGSNYRKATKEQWKKGLQYWEKVYSKLNKSN